MPEERTIKEEFKVNGDQLVETVKKLAREANVRHLIIKNEKGDSLMEIPLSVASVGVLLLPVTAAIGALAALVTHCTIVVVKVEKQLRVKRLKCKRESRKDSFRLVLFA